MAKASPATVAMGGGWHVYRYRDHAGEPVRALHAGLEGTGAELVAVANLPPPWSTILAQWRGVYFVYDTKRQAGYVGSACGAENILGRWLDYARSGHGNKRELRASDPNDLRFSILQRTSPDLDLQEIVALEATWKERLHTREFGLNRN